MARCLKSGLECIAVTDHNTIEGALAVQKIAPFMVIVGEEVTSSGGEITGLFIKEPIPKGLSPVETAVRIKEQGGLVSIPHPFDRFRSHVITPDALEEVLPHVDIIEAFNARNTFSRDNRRAQALAEARGLLVSAVSDSHTAVEVGRTYVEIPEFDATADGLMKALSQGMLVERPITPLIHFATTFTKIKKRFLRRHARQA